MYSLPSGTGRPVLLLRILLLLALVMPVPPAFPQTPPPQSREGILAEARLARDRMRAEFQQKASPTCGNRGRYDNEGLHLKVGQFPLLRFSGDMMLRDRFEAVGNGEGLVLNSEIHFLEQCNEQLGLYIVEVSMTEWSETITETIIVELTGPPTFGRFFGAPFPAPDSNAIAFVPDQGRGSRNKVEVALRDTMPGWSKVWEYSPPDGYVWSFIRWHAPNRFSVLMRTQGEQWESMFEFTPAALTRTDGPRVPAPPRP